VWDDAELAISQKTSIGTFVWTTLINTQTISSWSTHPCRSCYALRLRGQSQFLDSTASRWVPAFLLDRTLTEPAIEHVVSIVVSLE